MEIDATSVTSDETIETDTCIIGGGPAGLVVASELSARGRDVVVLESGARDSDAGVQALNDGDVVGDAYHSLRTTRHRQLGGTLHLWNTPTPHGAGAKYAPLDPWDMEPRWPEAPDGWPISYDELRPYYARAQEICGLGPLAYDAGAWTDASRLPLGADGGPLVPRVYQMGSRDALLVPLLDALRRSTSARVYTGATVVQLADSRQHAMVKAASVTGGALVVQAKHVVLAAGAIENARLLLVAAARGGGVEDRSGWLGRGFMEHPRDRAITLMPDGGSRYEELAFFDQHIAADGTTLLGRLALRDDVARAEGALNASATLLAIARPGRARVRSAMGRWGTLRALQRWLPPGGHGWSGHPDAARPFRGFVVLLNVEQAPHRENAIALGRRVDRYGVPLPALQWSWLREDHSRLVRVRGRVAQALRDSGLGRVMVNDALLPDPNAHHHAGTTRMHELATHGVVDQEGRVHGSDRLFVVGGSTFPSAGFVNPTLTVVAMAVRLATNSLLRG